MVRLALRGLSGSALSLNALLTAGAAAGCGPSFQAVYEGELHFEHCYALDEMQSASNDARKDCWREWLHGYTYGQSNDRVEYAATRFSELSLDPTLPSEDASDAGAHAVRHTEAFVAAPVPTNAFAPPPSTSDGRDGHEARDIASVHNAASHDPGSKDAGNVAAADPPPAPGAACVSSCESRWSGCRDGCKGAACGACDKTYRTCMPACFKDGVVAPKRH